LERLVARSFSGVVVIALLTLRPSGLHVALATGIALAVLVLSLAVAFALALGLALVPVAFVALSALLAGLPILVTLVSVFVLQSVVFHSARLPLGLVLGLGIDVVLVHLAAGLSAAVLLILRHV
jgi:hypothetical protein